MRKKLDIMATAALLAGELSTVCEGSVARTRDGSEVDDLSRYAHGAAAALGMLILYAEGDRERPTARQILLAALDWHEKQSRDVAEHPEHVTNETVDLRVEEADHE